MLLLLLLLPSPRFVQFSPALSRDRRTLGGEWGGGGRWTPWRTTRAMNGRFTPRFIGRSTTGLLVHVAGRPATALVDKWPNSDSSNINYWEKKEKNPRGEPIISCGCYLLFFFFNSRPNTTLGLEKMRKKKQKTPKESRSFLFLFVFFLFYFQRTVV